MKKYFSDDINGNLQSPPPRFENTVKSKTSILKRPQSKRKVRPPKLTSKTSARRKAALAANITLRNAAKSLKSFSGSKFQKALRLPENIDQEQDECHEKFRSVRFDSATSLSFSNMLSVPLPTDFSDRALEKAREIAARHNLLQTKTTGANEKGSETKVAPRSPKTQINKTVRMHSARSEQSSSVESELIVTEFREVLGSELSDDAKLRSAPLVDSLKSQHHGGINAKVETVKNQAYGDILG